MKDENRTKSELIRELKSLRRKVKRIEFAEHKSKQSEETPWECDDKFKYVFDFSTIGNSITLPTGEIYVNQTFCDMLGFTKDELQSTKWQAITHPDDIELTQREIDTLISGEKEKVRFNKRFIHKNGSIVWVDLSSSLRRNTAGEPLYLISSLMNITDRKQMEESLRMSHEMFQKAFHAIPNTLILHTLSEGRHLDVNESFLRLIGYRREEVIGRTALELALWWDLTQRDEYLRILRKQGSVRDMEVCVHTKSGEAHILLLSAEVIKVADQDCAILIGNDITERKQAEEKLRESEARYRNLFENSLMGISAASPDGHLIHANLAYAKMYGYENPEQMIADVNSIGQQLYANPEDRKEILHILAEKGFMAPREIDVVRRDGTHFFVLVSASEVRDSGGELLYLQANHIDISERKKIEEHLRKSESEYKELFDNSGTGIMIIGKDGKYLRVNKLCAKVFGKKVEEVEGKSMFDFLPVETAQKYLEENRSLIDSGGHREYEDTFSMAEGKKIFLIVDQVLHDTNRQGYALQSSSVDITERKQVEEALHKSEVLYRAVVEDQTEIICRFKPDGTFTFVNDVYCRFFGKPSSELIGKKWQPTVVPEDLSQVEAKLQRLSLDHPVETVENRVYNGNGDIRWMQFVNRAFFDSDKRIVETQAVGRDITTQKLVEEALRESEKRYRQLFDSSPDGIVVIGLDGRIMRANIAQAQMYRYESPGDLIGVHATQLVAVSSRDYSAQIMERRLNGEDIPPVEYELVRKDGTTFYGETSATILRKADGTVSGYICTTRDTTERKRIDEKLKRKQKMLVRTESIAHIGSWEWDIATDTVTWSNELFQIFQRDPREGAPNFAEHSHFYHPDDMARLQSAVEAALAYRTPYMLELRAIRKDGETRTCVARGFLELGQDGRPILLFGSLQDITERKRAEEEINKQKEILQRIVDNIPMMITYFDEPGNIKMINYEFVKRMGWTLEDWKTENILAKSYPESEDFKEALDFMTSKPIGWKDFKTTTKYGTVIDTTWTNISLSNGVSMGIGQDITERKRVEEEIRKSHEELRMLANHLQNIREEERTHLAREFHDQLGQSMTALKMDLSLLIRMISDEKQDIQRNFVAEELQSMQKLLDETSQLLWAIVTELRPQMLDDLGLITTFAWEAKRFESRSGISCEFKSSEKEIFLEPKKSIALFRIFQEALTNVARHAHATVVKSILRREKEMLVLEIKDNGCGISIDKKSKPESFGLIGMRERAMAIGGLVEINGIAGEGTTIIVRLPIGQNDEQESTSK